MVNEFETICKNLSKCKCGCVDNLYICAEEAIKEYVGTDRKKLLQIKAQAEGGNFYEYSALMIALAALVISIFDAVFNFDHIIIKQIKMAILAGYGLYVLCKILKYITVLKWRKYILVAIVEIERKWK